MTSTSTNTSKISISLGSKAFLLAMLFVGLKLAEVIDWAWWIVLCPLWAGLALLAALATGVFGGLSIVVLWHVLWRK